MNEIDRAELKRAIVEVSMHSEIQSFFTEYIKGEKSFRAGFSSDEAYRTALMRSYRNGNLKSLDAHAEKEVTNIVGKYDNVLLAMELNDYDEVRRASHRRNDEEETQRVILKRKHND